MMIIINKMFTVIAIDIDPLKLEYAKHNAKIYGVEDRIDFICADFFTICKSLKADVVFMRYFYCRFFNF